MNRTMNDKTKAKGVAGDDLKTIDDLGSINLKAGAYHLLSYKGTEGGSVTITRTDENEGDITIMVDSQPKTLKPGDTFEHVAKGEGTIEVLSASGGEFTLSTKASKAPNEEVDKKAAK